MQLAYSPGMGKAEAEETSGDVRRPESIRRQRRRLKLLALMKEIKAQLGGPPSENPGDLRGAAGQAEIDTGTPRTHFVAMLKGRRGLGDDLAQKLERVYGKPAGWFDADAQAVWPFSLELQEEILNLEPEDLHFMEVAMWTHLKKAVPVKLSYTSSDERPVGEVQKPPTIVSPRTTARAPHKKVV